MPPDQVPPPTAKQSDEAWENRVILEQDLARTVDENLTEYRQCMDMIDAANASKSGHHKRREQLDRWATEYREREGVDGVKTDGVLSLTMTDAIRWSVTDWEAFVLGLIGVDVTDRDKLETLADACNDYDADAFEVIDAIKALLTFGDLHVINKVKSDKKMDALAASGVAMVGGAAPSGYTKVRPLRPPGAAISKA